MYTSFTVNQISEMLNKSTTTIYTYLKKGKLDGVKSNGVWTIRFNEAQHKKYVNKENNDKLSGKNENIEVDIQKSFDNSVYLSKLTHKLIKYEDILKEADDNLSKQVSLNKKLEKAEGTTKFTSKLPMSINAAKEIDGTYKYIVESKENVKTEIDELKNKYNEIKLVMENIKINKIKCSNISESAYIYIDKTHLINLLNRLSTLNKKFFILNEDVFDENIIKLRFSSHLPEYFTANSTRSLSKSREVDILIPYSDLKDKFDDFSPAMQTESDKKDIQSINKKISIAKRYSSRPLINLSIEELNRYYEITIELTSNERASNIGFVKSLKMKKIAIKRHLNKINKSCK